jgi:hypothetical protein
MKEYFWSFSYLLDKMKSINRKERKVNLRKDRKGKIHNIRLCELCDTLAHP